MAQYRNQGDKYVNTTLPSGTGTGTATDPYSRITQAISALGTSGGRIVVTGGVLIQEDCTKLYSGVARSTSNSAAIEFVFDSLAYTDCSQTVFFRVSPAATITDTVRNMQWYNGLPTPDTSKGVSPQYRAILHNCALDKITLQYGAVSCLYSAYGCSFSGCSCGNSSGTSANFTEAVNCVFYRCNVGTDMMGAYKNCYATLGIDGLRSISPTANNGGNTCESGAIIGATAVGDPQFIDPAGLNFLVSPTSPLVGAGAFDLLSGRQVDSGLGLSTYKYNGLSSVFQKSNGAVYSQTLGVDDVVVDPTSGLFSLTPGKMRGKVKSGLMDKGKKSITKNIGGRRLTTYTDLTMPDYFICAEKAPHKAICSGTAADNTHIVLSALAVATDDYYNGMIVTITAGSGTPGRYTVLDYVGLTKTAELSASTGAITDATTAYKIDQAGNMMFDFDYRYGDTVTAINAAPYISQEWQAQPLVNGGLGAADPGFVANGAQEIDCRIEQMELTLNKYNHA